MAKANAKIVEKTGHRLPAQVWCTSAWVASASAQVVNGYETEAHVCVYVYICVPCAFLVAGMFDLRVPCAFLVAGMFDRRGGNVRTAIHWGPLENRSWRFKWCMRGI